MLFDGFEQRRIACPDGVAINVCYKGSGPPLLLLHGYPQTHAMWHRVAPALAQDYMVVCPDLRGYGDSSKPEGGPDHAAYSKRAMAADMVHVMGTLGHERFAVVGHDRGGRVGHRMALDHADRVSSLAVLDIVPTHTLFARTDKAFAIGYYHWFFLAQPAPLPETLIGADPAFFLSAKMGHWSAGGAIFDEHALAEYRRCFAMPETIHASCEDYRAAAAIDLDHDQTDIDAGRNVTCPMLVLWGEKGLMHKLYDVMATWRERCGDVRGGPVPSGHFLAEEAPERTLLEIRAFLSDLGGV